MTSCQCANSEKDSEYSDEYRAQSQDSTRIILYPDLYFLPNDEHWTMTPETHKSVPQQPEHFAL